MDRKTALDAFRDSWRPSPGTMALSPAQQAALVLMACLNCGATMRRGSQCGRCGAWCR